jgi:hypothetical protein
MRRDKALIDIVQEAQRLSRDLPKVVWYGFGSFFMGQESFGDIDILIVCPTIAAVLLVRTMTEEMCVRWPVHLVIMTEDEQRETGFVASEGCMMLHATGAEI